MSDIHGNIVAFEQVLESLAEHGVDRYLCLGDIVGYGARPNECCDLVRELAPVAVAGNHDLAASQPGMERWFTSAARASILWTRETLTSDNLDFLQSLAVTTSAGDARLCHASLTDTSTYVAWPEQAMESFALMDGMLCFFGHTHYAEWFVQNQAGKLPEQLAAASGAVVRLEECYRYMINPGAVGQPRDGDSRAAFAIYDDMASTVEILRVEYDIASTQKQITAAGLPSGMATRLANGR